MVETTVLVVAGAFVLFGGLVLSRARELHGRYATIDGIATADEERIEPGGETTIGGPVHVFEPASPERTGPELNGTGSPALWAWRVRRKRATGGTNGTARWRTVESGLAVGEFAVDHSWDRVRVDAATLATERDDEPTDPFDSPRLFLGEPAEDVYLGDLDPVNRFLERTGLADDEGILRDWEVSISVGGTTTMPDKYQATVVRDGDELVVRGELTETADGYVLRGTDETPLVIASGDLEDQRRRLRSKARTRVIFGGALVALGVIAAVNGYI